MDALFSRAARLPKVPFEAPERVISQTTVAALQSGLVPASQARSMRLSHASGPSSRRRTRP